MSFHLSWLFAFLVLLAGNAHAIVSRYVESYPPAESKKGLQVEMADDALALGIKHAALNLNLCALIDPLGDTNNPSWEFEKCTYRFRRGLVERMDERIRALSDQGVLVNLIMLTYQSGDSEVNRIMVHPRCILNAPNWLGAFNTVTDEGRRWFSATMEFCAERWSRPDRKFGRVVGYIIGNEVNSHWWWSNMGRVSMTEFADDYLRTVRLAHQAIRKQSSWARVYLSLEHHWNIRYPAGDDQQAFPARPFLDYFSEQAKRGGDFDWHVAFHPYPENLFEPRFWNDKTATTNDETPRITFKNIEMLPVYLRRPELLHNGKPRRIILSEQGFHTKETPDGETIQAAAFCYAYKKVEALTEIDAFILHRHVDSDAEGGLLLGLRRNKPSATEARPKKKIYECFRAADTAEWETAFAFAPPVIGVKNWAEVAAVGQLQQQDVFLRGGNGYHTYRIPSLIVTKKGTVLALCEGRKNSGSDTGDIDVVLKRSTDSGKTWSQPQVVWDDGANTCGNPCPVVDQTTGVIWLLLTHNPGDLNEKQIKSKKDARTRTVWVSRSEDDGKTWSPPVNITASTKDSSWGWYATGPGVGIQIQHGGHKGRLVVPCDHTYDDPQGTLRGLPIEWGAHIIYSDDHGQSWKLGGTARPKMNECQVVELADGKGSLLLNMRSYFGENRRAQSVSCDGGQTWSAPESHAQLIESVCEASIVRYNWPNEKQPGRILFSNPASTKRENMTVRVSYDDGKSWPLAKVLHEGPSAYSCLAVLPDKSIGCLCECGRTNAYEKITFARFPVSWLEGEK